MNQNLL